LSSSIICLVAALLAVPFDERFPDPVETRRPQTSLPPLFQRLRSGQRPWLAIENVEIVFKIQDLLLTAVTALVTGDTPAVMPQLTVLAYALACTVCRLVTEPNRCS